MLDIAPARQTPDRRHAGGRARILIGMADPAPRTAGDGAAREPIVVSIVPHTHWDREWYSPFQAFRMRLVDLFDRLLPLLENDLSYTHFMLDGQTAVIDDYLEIRPAAASTLRRLATAGRISIGPWAILMDEYMVSGETIVRDLQIGLARATELGGAMPVGYLPDMFGHVAQMPQILRLAGLEHAVVWRGVPAAVDKTAFWWEAPDGSRVRTEFLYGSYSNGMDLPDDPKMLALRAMGYEHELGPARLPGGDLLLMNGTDHELPQPWLGRVVAEANAERDDYRFEITSLPAHLARQPVDGLPTWRGELRSGARANVLMGVASNRVDVHRAAAAAERAVERRAEPLVALFAAPDAYPRPLLDVAWHELVLNSAHDSSCACSHDETVAQVLVRYHEARQIGDGLVDETVRRVATELDAPAGTVLVVNPTAAARGGLVRTVVAKPGPVHFVGPGDEAVPTQAVGTIRSEALAITETGRKVSWVLDLMNGSDFAGTRIGSMDRVARPDGVTELVFHGVHPDEPAMDLDALRPRLLEEAGDDKTIRFFAWTPPVREVVFSADPVPGFGWSSYRDVEGPPPTTAVRASPATTDETGHGPGEGAAGAELANEHLTVRVGADGTWSVATDGVEVAGLGRLVDGGDGGDTYNYSPPAADRIVERPEAVRVEVLEHGPVRARVRVEADYLWPTHAEGDERSCSARSDTTAPVTVSTVLELRTGERFCRVRTEWDNTCRDHRVRVHFPLPARAASSHAECAFAVVERGLTAEGGPHEAGLPTFVSRRFVDAGDGEQGLAVLHDGLLEYELVDDGRELALTLLRATGYLSRSEPSLRPNPAGPLDPLQGPQMFGPVMAEYALLPHTGDWTAAALHEAADELLVPLERAWGGGREGASRKAEGQELRVDGAPVSAVHRDAAGHLVVRVHNPYPDEREVEVSTAAGAATGWVIDLRGAPVEPFPGSYRLRPHEILTVRV